MESITSHLTYKHFDNITAIHVGLQLFLIGIYDFVLDKIKTEHKTLYTICASGTCTKQNCSKRFKMFKDWCQSCSKWKSELKKIKSNECRHWDRINWKALNSSDWPQSIDEMAKVFVKKPHIHYRDGVFYDLGAVVSILTNMNIFTFDKTTLEEILRMRNDYYGHNYSNGLQDTEKTLFFNKILHFIKLKEICGYRSAINCIPGLEELQVTEHLTQKLLDKLLEKETLDKVRDEILQKVPLERALLDQNEIVANNQMYSDFKRRLDELIVSDKANKISEIRDRKSSVKQHTKLWTIFRIKYDHLLRILLFSALFVMLKKPTADHTGIYASLFKCKLIR